MKRSNQPSRGFTLIEVLAALVIVAIGMMAVIEAVSQTAGNAAYLRHKTVAHWVAMNRLTEMRLSPYDQLSVGDSTGEVEMANERWRWSAAVTSTAVTSMKRIDVGVASLADGDEKNQLATISGFVGEKIAKAGTVSALWDVPPILVSKAGKGTPPPLNPGPTPK